MSNENITGYPSIDKPWLKYHSYKAINSSLPECTIYEYIFNQNQDNLDSIAINYYGTDITYRKLFQDISLIAGGFEKIGVHEGDVVTVCMINSPEAIEVMFALNKIGAVANMIYGVSSVDEIRQYLLDSSSTVVVCLDIFQEKFIKLSKEVTIDKIIVANQIQSMSEEEKNKATLDLGIENIPLPKDERFISWNEFISNATPSVAISKNPDAAAVITYTGGTTGGSKGVVLSNKSVVAVTWQYINLDMPMRKDGTWVLVLPLFIAYGVACSMTVPLAVGMKLVVRIPMTDSIADIVKKFQPNYIMYGPAYWEAFANDNEDIDLSCFIDPVSGGDFLRANAEEKINNYLLKHRSPCKIMNGYGMSEIGVVGSMSIPNASEFGSVGIPLAKNVIAAFDTETAAELKYGEIGEICIQTPSIMMGYVNNPQETKNILRRHNDGQLWIHSGDLGYVSETGFVYLIGRIKRFMLCISGGVQKKVFSLDIEKVLLAHKKVANCAVVPVPDKEINEAPVAYVILKEEYINEVGIECELKKYCESNLLDVYRPVKYIFVKKFPLTKVGKVDYMKLEELAKQM